MIAGGGGFWILGIPELFVEDYTFNLIRQVPNLIGVRSRLESF